MNIVEQSETRLVLEDHSFRLAAAMVLMAVVLGVGLWSEQRSGPEIAFGPTFLLLMAWFSNYRATTIFDRDRGVIRYDLKRIGRRRVEEHATADIVILSLRIPPASRALEACHLQITLRDGHVFWLSRGSHRPRERMQALLNEILEFLDLETRQTLEAEVREMAHAGDTVGAVKLLRAESELSLTDAKRKVDGFIDDGTESGVGLDELVRSGKLLKAVRLLEKNEGLTRKAARARVRSIRASARAR
ncbi:MAG: hypothetical protein E2P02_12000 [Acidobacteria bacterium]|nr:MAG: hypothetical protein E2P02_12000 [Acidobacteriota bacterium]